MKQQSWPALQHWVPQHVAPMQLVVPQGGVSQVPVPQYGSGPAHGLLQPPQLRMSLRVLTQTPLQHLKSWHSASVWHATRLPPAPVTPLVPPRPAAPALPPVPPRPAAPAPPPVPPRPPAPAAAGGARSTARATATAGTCGAARTGGASAAAGPGRSRCARTSARPLHPWSPLRPWRLPRLWCRAPVVPADPVVPPRPAAPVAPPPDDPPVDPSGVELTLPHAGDDHRQRRQQPDAAQPSSIELVWTWACEPPAGCGGPRRSRSLLLVNLTY